MKEPETANRIGPRFRDSLRGFIRRLARVEAVRVRVSVNKGNSCDSYHLSVLTPAGSHVAGMTLVDAEGKRVLRPTQPAYDLARGYFRVGGKSSSTAHLYARGLVHCPTAATVPRNGRPSYLELNIFEKPPGAMGTRYNIGLNRDSSNLSCRDSERSRQ